MSRVNFSFFKIVLVSKFAAETCVKTHNFICF
nr:MAG TPA: hypothetical protein [Caudoviricetes sp.]